ncbi:unnamed protein product [Hymenolepis diminuta]|uniref:Ig-like domain-containing protein n=1 Tax=Hymenolepis diminuta TaxID=6216 RepID=A0A0R3SSS4_HYMDI|nr:unnamed protein product [Hymenolepis diminuta]
MPVIYSGFVKDRVTGVLTCGALRKSRVLDFKWMWAVGDGLKEEMEFEEDQLAGVVCLNYLCGRSVIFVNICAFGNLNL